ncbi:MAG: hypothetical protein JST15_06325 [Bacteroidetes bacterium]|nr:hypothetical protein [Bacteroidota bacterium]
MIKHFTSYSVHKTHLWEMQYGTNSRDKKNPYLGLQNNSTCAKVKEVWKF